MSEFSDRPFVAGSIHGLRSFRVDKLGRLTGVSHLTVWTPGENVAKCSGHCSSAHTDAIAGRISFTEYFRREQAAKSEVHKIAGLAQSCGFWAYFDGSNDFHRPGQVAAVVEGYGTVTVGTRGFRAEKAKIVGFVRPRQGPLNWPAWPVLGTVLPLVAGVTNLLAGVLWVGLVLLGLAAANGAFLAHSLRSRRGSSSGALDRVLHNYPDVPVFRSARTARRHFNVSHPAPAPVPTPETAEDFWTRSAS